MPSVRRVQATFAAAEAVSVDPEPRADESGARGPEAAAVPRCGVWLRFRPHTRRLDVDRIDDYADLGPELTLAAIEGLGKVRRLLRAARIALPSDSFELTGEADLVAGLLERAVGTRVVLELRPRSRIRFVAWTEAGVETVDHVTEVLEDEDAYLVLRNKGRFPVRLPRDRVVRQRTELERWYEVLHIERARADG